MSHKNPQLYSLTTLESLDAGKIEHIRALGIHNIGDLIGFQPFRYARHIRAAKDGLLRRDEIDQYLDESAQPKALEEILDAPTESIKGVGQKAAGVLKRLGLATVSDLAEYMPFEEAEQIVTTAVTDETDPFAPPCLLPICKKFTRNTKSFASFFKQKEIRDLSVLSKNDSLIANLFYFGGQVPKVIYLGYTVSYLQDWIYSGVHLGEPQGSVNLFMAQDTQVSVLDWRRSMRFLRFEDTRVRERLANTLYHQRAVDEVARATAEEHQYGATSAFGANAATAGSFVAAGAVVGGVGGGISGALTGLVLGNVANAAGGAPTLAGAAVGTAVGSFAGAAAGSLVFAGATTLGYVETDAQGDRAVVGKSAQNIQQRTVQNASAIRSLWSNIVSQGVEEEQQRIETDRVVNHNRIHALNALYFEVLNEYRVNMRVNDVVPIVFIPFKPITFTEDILRRYWWAIRTLLTDDGLVSAMDEYFLSLTTDPSPATQLAALPEISQINTKKIKVAVNLDGSAMQDLIENLAIAAFGSLGWSPVGGALLVLMNIFYENLKRENIGVSVVTSQGSRVLQRISSPNADPNLIGEYELNDPIPVHTIQGIRIENKNAEFSLQVPFFGPIDVNELVFEDIKARILIQNSSSFSESLPNLLSLEDMRTVYSGQLSVSANDSEDIPWNIADRLRDQFEGINAQREGLEDATEAEESIEARIDRLIGFLNANKYGFTRFILQQTEREQLAAVLESVEIGGEALTSVAGTVPLGFSGNHLVLPLKSCEGGTTGDAPLDVDTSKLELMLEVFGKIDLKDKEALRSYFEELQNEIDRLIAIDPGSARLTSLLSMLAQLRDATARYLEMIGGGTTPITGPALERALVKLRDFIAEHIAQILVFIRTPVQTSSALMSQLCMYYDEIKQALADKIGKLIASDDVSLPSPAVFMEPVLSNAKGAELYDMRRNSHYDILPAPGIGTADPNTIRAQGANLSPTLPPSSLTIQNAPEYPLPNHLTTALTEAGRLDLSTLITQNAGSLNSMLTNLSNVASELAKASAQLTGEAQKEALSTAGEVAKQIASTIEKSLESAAKGMSEPTTEAPAPPRGQQEKAEVVRELDRINNSTSPPKTKKEKKKTIGVPSESDDTRDYQMAITFIDENGVPYSEGEFTLSMTFFETGETVDINGGAPISFSSGQFVFPSTYTLNKGRAATMQISVELASVNVPGIKDFTLPDKSDIVFRCRMLSETHLISATDVKTAVDQVVESSSFGAGLTPLFEQFLNAGVEFPFRIFNVSAEGGSKTQLNLRLEYNHSESETSTNTTGNTTTTQYEVVIPKNGWNIEVV